MAEGTSSTIAAPGERLNVADRLARWAAEMPTEIAVAAHCRSAACRTDGDPTHVHYEGRTRGASGADYATINFFKLDANATRLAYGLLNWGVRPGTRIALLVRPGIEFVTLVFALLRAGAVIVLVDPGLGRRNLVRCLSEAEPEGFIAIPLAQAVRSLLRHKFPKAKWNVTVGRRWFWGGLNLQDLYALGSPGHGTTLPETRGDDAAAIIFTSGSTGVPKGVLYTHRMFDTQVTEIQSMYGLEPGGIDLSCFPLFALFNSAMGVTTVFPEMEFSRPASADPRKLLAAANDWKVTQAFASPAVWPKLSEHSRCAEARVETLREIFACGAPVPSDLQQKTLKYVAPLARMHTPYGGTECLPVSTIAAAEVLAETAARTAEGAGICVGRKFDSIEWRVIRITDESIEQIEDAEELVVEEIGELIVRGPQASPLYMTRPECNAAAKIADAAGTWHRMGDVGYLDERGRFWYCGRKSQRVVAAKGPMFTECVERVFDSYRLIGRCALVGVGPKQAQTPVLVYEENLPREIYNPHPDGPHMAWELSVNIPQDLSTIAAQHDSTKAISHFLKYPRLPVDVRHNAKINREQLAEWAASKLPELS